MSNPLFNMLGNNINNPMIQQFKQFKNNYKGDARQQVQNMLNSGQITQEQYNNAVNMANQLQNILK